MKWVLHAIQLGVLYELSAQDALGNLYTKATMLQTRLIIAEYLSPCKT